MIDKAAALGAVLAAGLAGSAAAQADLVRIRATFTPRIVKMAP